MKRYIALVVLCLGASLYGMDEIAPMLKVHECVREAVKDLREEHRRETYKFLFSKVMLSSETLRSTLDVFPDLNEWENEHGDTYLHKLAECSNDEEVIRIMLGRGQDLNQENNFGQTVEQVAFIFDNSLMLSLIEKYKNAPWCYKGKFAYHLDNVDDGPEEQSVNASSTDLFGSISSYFSAKNIVVGGIGLCIVRLAWKKYGPSVDENSKA